MTDCQWWAAPVFNPGIIYGIRDHDQPRWYRPISMIDVLRPMQEPLQHHKIQLLGKKRLHKYTRYKHNRLTEDCIILHERKELVEDKKIMTTTTTNRKGMTIPVTAAILLFIIWCTVSDTHHYTANAYFVPGVNPHSYKDGEMYVICLCGILCRAKLASNGRVLFNTSISRSKQCKISIQNTHSSTHMERILLSIFFCC